jgi:hypothetical protein
MRFSSLGFADAASRIDEIIRNVKPDSVSAKREITDGERQAPHARAIRHGDLESFLLAIVASSLV